MNQLNNPELEIISAIERSDTKSLIKLLQDPTLNLFASGYRALEVATERNDIQIVKILLSDHRCDYENFEENEFGERLDGVYPLEICAKHGYVELLDVLLEDHRFDLGVRDQSELQIACAGGQTEVVHRLLQDPRVRVSTIGYEGFWQAVENNHFEVVQVLLADPQGQNVRFVGGHRRRINKLKKHDGHKGLLNLLSEFFDRKL